MGGKWKANSVLPLFFADSGSKGERRTMGGEQPGLLLESVEERRDGIGAAFSYFLFTSSEGSS